MRVFRVTDSAATPGLVEGTAPQPQPGPGELMVRVCAAGVTASELLWFPTSHEKSGEKRTAAIPGHEFSGIIEDVGGNVASLEIGQEVFGMNDWFADGATAEYCVAQFSAVAPKPSRLTHVEAASVPIGALTAWQGLFDHARLQPGERVLVHGGAGAVGVFAIQLARSRGAHVIATASARNVDFVAGLGAEQVIDHGKTRFEEVARDMDVVFDTVGGETLDRSWAVLKSQGRMATIVSPVPNATEEREKNAFFIVEPNQKQLMEIAALLQAGSLRTFVDSVVPLSQAPDAYGGRIHRRGRGKLVVAIAA